MTVDELIYLSEMIIDGLPGYYLKRTIPPIPHSKQAYIMKPLDVRRHRLPFVDDEKWTRDIEKLTFIRSYELEQFSFQNEQMRKEFVFKVFGLLFCQLSYILINLLIVFSIDETKAFFGNHLWIVIALNGIALFFYILLLIFKTLRKKRIVNLTIVSLMVMFFAMGISSLATVHHFYAFFYTFAIGSAVAFSITILAKYGPCSVASCGMICCILAVIASLFSVVACLIISLTGFKKTDIGIAGIAVIISSLYFMFDIREIMDDDSLHMTPLEFVRGNIHLYIDIILRLVRLIFNCYKMVKNKIKPSKSQ